jgi:hypothetical protein
MPSQMDLTATLTLAAACIALAIFAGWRGARPPNPHRGPRMIPWRAIMVGSVALSMPFLVHALNLLGVTTGTNSRP